MNLQVISQLLDALEQPAFYAQDGVLIRGNAACASLHLMAGTPIAQLLSPDADSLPASGGVCRIGEARYELSCIPMEEGRLYLLRGDPLKISVNALSNTAKSLRSGLQQIFTAAEQLDRRLPDEDPLLDNNIAGILQGVSRISRIADNLELLQRLRSGDYLCKRMRVDLLQSLRELLEKAEGLLFDAGIWVSWSLPPGSMYGSMDLYLLRQIFWNLMSNAAMQAQGGAICVGVQRLRLNKLLLKFTDSGTMPEFDEDFMHSFEQPVDRPNGSPGVGIGLSVVQYAAQQLGGSFALSMTPGGNTTAAVLLDISAPASPELFSNRAQLVQSLDDGLVGLSDTLPVRSFDRRGVLG